MMKNKRWQNVAFGVAFAIPVIGFYFGKRLFSRNKNRSRETQPEVTRIRIPLMSLIGINDEVVSSQTKQHSIVLPDESANAAGEAESLLSSNSAQGYYVASSEGGKFHLPDCRWAKKIKPENSLTLENKSIAFERGYTSCSICNP